MIILDSGLGGISVVRALRATHPALRMIYCADTAGFPYGSRTPEDIRDRATRLVKALLARYPDAPIVLACNTLSTLCLDHLRKMFSVPFVGTVPAIKTAAQISAARRFSILATPNTTTSQYTQDLIAEFASDCVVDAYGAPNLAIIAENALLGSTPELAPIQQELKPIFCHDAFGKTDCVVLGCTHYPLILPLLEKAAPWPVRWVDSSEAIARRALTLSDTPPAESIAYLTGTAQSDAYRNLFLREGFSDMQHLAIA